MTTRSVTCWNRLIVGATAAVVTAGVSAAALAAPGKVTTRLEWPYGCPFAYCTGTVVATFVAVPAGDGSWNVAAKFQPHNVIVLQPNTMPGDPAQPYRVRGVGTAAFNAIPGVPVTVTAEGSFTYIRTVTIGQDGIITG